MWGDTLGRPRTRGAKQQLRDALPLLPFLAVVAIFLVTPTVTVIVNAFIADGAFSLARIHALFSSTALAALAKSVLLSGSTAIIGAVLGAVLAWLIVSSPAGDPNAPFVRRQMVRRAVISLCSVLAQFGGVALAFAFLATVGLNGVLTLWVQQAFGWNLAASGWLYSLSGLMLVYTYFQIPLMVIVFVPALEGLRDEWREAAISLGASRWQYFREVAVPLLTPAFLGSALLLFANAFAAYATAAALVSQGSPIVPLLIRSALTSEVVLGQSGFAYALALEMIVVVALVMLGYNALVRRTARWLR
jgi:putative spermidine/putrescine transport system permease protein